MLLAHVPVPEEDATLDRRYNWEIRSYRHVERPCAMDAFTWREDVELRAQLRQASGIAEELAALSSDWDRILRLTAFVHGLSAHQGWDEAPDLSGLRLLADVRAGKVTFRCVEFSHMLQQLLAAFGYPARVVGLRREGSQAGLGKSHVVCDVWRGEDGKWIELDVQLNTAYRDRSGRLLSALEVHDLVRAGRHAEISLTREAQMRENWEDAGAKDSLSPEDIEEVQGFTREEIWEMLPDHGDYDGFTHFWLDNHYHLTFNQRYGLERPKALTGAADGGTFFYSDPGDVPPLAFQGMRQTVTYVQDRRTIDFPLEGVELQWVLHEVAEDAPPAATRRLTLLLRHSMPWFHHFCVTVDGKAVEVRDEALVLSLHPGENTVEVTAVNDLGRHGSTAQVVFFVPL